MGPRAKSMYCVSYLMISPFDCDPCPEPRSVRVLDETRPWLPSLHHRLFPLPPRDCCAHDVVVCIGTGCCTLTIDATACEARWRPLSPPLFFFAFRALPSNDVCVANRWPAGGAPPMPRLPGRPGTGIDRCLGRICQPVASGTKLTSKGYLITAHGCRRRGVVVYAPRQS